MRAVWTPLWVSLLLVQGGMQAVPAPYNAARRVHSWQQLGLWREAQKEVNRWLTDSRDHPEALGWVAVLLARDGETAGMAKALRIFKAANPGASLHDHVLEEVAWATLQEASRHGTIQQRAMALMGQMATRDTRALHELHRALQDPSPVMRSLAVQMTGMCWDLETSLHLEKQLEGERNPDVRLALLRALGHCGTPLSLDGLMKIHTRGDAQEQLAALESLSAQQGEVSLSVVEGCVAHPRAGMRALGAHLALHLTPPVALQFCLRLIQDPHAQVRAAAWSALSHLSLSSHSWKQLQPFWNRIDQERDRSICALASARALTHDASRAMDVLKKSIQSGSRTERYQAITAILSAGPSGLPLLEQVAQEHSDPYMRMNALIGCLVHRRNVSQHLRQLSEEIRAIQERMMPMRGVGLLAVAPSEVGHHPGIPNLPEAMDLMVRLRLAHLIVSCGGSLPLEELTHWLQERRWGLTSAAAQMLLSEGDAAAAEVVRALLDHPSPKVRFQAAMVLAVIAKDESALPHLVEAGCEGDPEVEEQLVDAAGGLASRQLLPFLEERLSHPSPQMRLMAASSILQILNEDSRI